MDYLTDDDVRRMLREFYERNPNPMAEPLTAAFEAYRAKNGVWPDVVLRDFGLEAVVLYRKKDPG